MLRYSLEFISGVPYLVPFGQAVSCGGRSIRLNKTGALMWQKLCEAVSACGGEIIIGQDFGTFFSESCRTDSTQQDSDDQRNDSITQLPQQGFGDMQLPQQKSGDVQTYTYEDIRHTWINSLCSEFEAYSDEDRALITADAHEFINMLNAHYVFCTPAHISTLNRDRLIKHFCIAGLHMSYDGPSGMYPEDFDVFADAAANASPDTNVIKSDFKSAADSNAADCRHEHIESLLPDVRISVSGILTRTYELGTPLVKTRDVSLFSVSGRYFLTFDTFSVIRECEIHPDGRVSMYYNIPSVKESGKCINAILAGIDYERGRYEVFHAARFAFLFFNRRHGIYALHSASFLYRDRLWLVSAPSGTGKSTHVNIWNRVFDVKSVNGDLNCIDISCDGASADKESLSESHVSLTVPGTPWCGTSGIFDKSTYKLGGIILLSRGEVNRASSIDETDTAILSVANRLITPAWDENMLKSNISAAAAIVSNSLVFTMECDMSDDAAKVCKEYIDAHLDAHF